MAATMTNRGLQVLSTNDASALDIRTAAFTGTVPAAATIRDWNFLSDVIASALVEAAATSYARQDLAGVAAVEDDGTDQVDWTATAPTISAVGVGETWTCVAHYVYNASDAAAELIYVDEPTSPLVTNGGDVTLPRFNVVISQP